MNFFHFIPPEFYYTIYVIVVCTLCYMTSIYYSFSFSDKCLKYKSLKGLINTCLLAFLMIMFLGPRPVHAAFVDTGYYVFGYNNLINSYKSFSLSDEWLWNNFEFICKEIGLSSQAFLLVVEVIYISIPLIICIRLFQNHPWIAFLFFLSSFSFYSYGTNGIRNGMACHIMLLAIVMINGLHWEKIVSFVLMFISYSIHRSTAVPILCVLASVYIIRSTKISMLIWVASIFISLIAGNILGDYFSQLGLFEDKSNYFLEIEESGTEAQFSSTGFRFDFLLYSTFPILLVWYLTIKRNFNDTNYNIIANTYILANAFWIMVIRASFSNRFAYLSWFLYPLVIVYPLLRMKIWKHQDLYLAIILFLYAGFKMFMSFVYYGN